MILPLPLLLDQVPCRFANLGVLRKQECELHLPWLHLPWLHLTMATLTMVLRKQECERVQALRTELTKCGASVVEEGDTLSVRLRRPRLLPPLAAAELARRAAASSPSVPSCRPRSSIGSSAMSRAAAAAIPSSRRVRIPIMVRVVIMAVQAVRVRRSELPSARRWAPRE